MFESHYRFILPGAQEYFDFKAEDAKAIAAINVIRENNLPVFVADWSNDAYDVVFFNVPHLKCRYFNPDPITEHLPESDIFGELNTYQNDIFSMFGFSLSNTPTPTVIDAWEEYKDWMKFLI